MSATPIMPGVPDLHSLRSALAMGYVIHGGRLWWPMYDFARADGADFRRWSFAINQARRTGLLLARSPDSRERRLLPWSEVQA